MTRSHEYKYAESAETKIIQTPINPCLHSRHYARNTTLLLLAAKTKSWSVVKAILQLDPEEYPSLLKEVGNQKKHPLYHQDESKANCFHLAIEDFQIDICQMIITLVDVYTLKTIPISGGQTALKFINQKVREGFDDFEKLQISIIRKIQKNKN